MRRRNHLVDFMRLCVLDKRLNANHIVLYLTLFIKFKQSGVPSPAMVFRHQIMKMCRIKDDCLFELHLKQLQKFGYIRYNQSPSRLGSMIIHMQRYNRNSSNF